MPPPYDEAGKPILRYRNNIVKVLNNYPPGSASLVVAIDALITTAVERLQERRLEDIATQSCQGLHDGPAKGLVCRRCFDSKELGATSQEVLMMGETVPAVRLAEQEENAIEKQVRMLIGAPEEE